MAVHAVFEGGVNKLHPVFNVSQALAHWSQRDATHAEKQRNLPWKQTFAAVNFAPGV